MIDTTQVHRRPLTRALPTRRRFAGDGALTAVIAALIDMGLRDGSPLCAEDMHDLQRAARSEGITGSQKSGRLYRWLTTLGRV